MDIHNILSHIAKKKDITQEELCILLNLTEQKDREVLYNIGRETSYTVYQRDVYIRGLIEFTNWCKNDCYYCGLRRSNTNLERYRLQKDEILACVENGYKLGFRTVVLQGGEDPYYDDETVCDIVRGIRSSHKDIAITLSIGERDRESYQAFFEAGADRYLLRHETADRKHYESLLPDEMSFEHRRTCLYDLKDIGYQVGCGFMVGSPGQSIHTLYEDLRFILDCQPHMVGIGPFLPQKDTPLGGRTAAVEGVDGTRSSVLDVTLALISILRILSPKLLIPATTALGTADPKGRERGILSGANVIMPNLSPVNVRDKYLLYDGKICTGEEAAECIECLRRRIKSIGYEIVTDRGDHPDMMAHEFHEGGKRNV